METKPRKLSNRAVAGIVLGTIALMVLVTWWVIRASTDRAWEAMERRRRELVAEIERRPTVRPVTRGAAESGNAWDEYELALAASKTTEALEHLQRGARRADARFAAGWAAAPATREPNWDHIQRLGAWVEARSARLAFESKGDDAANLLVDFLQFVRDAHGIGGKESTARQERELAFSGLRHLMSSGRCTTGQLTGLERQIGILESAWPDARISLETFVLMSMSGVLAEVWYTQEFDEASFRDKLRFGYSYRLMGANLVQEIVRLSARLAALESAPWQVCLVVLGEVEKEIRASRNPLLRNLHFADPVTIGRETRAQLRLLQVEARYRATGEFAAPADPFGTVLQHSVSADHVTFWSVGPDGIDNGGDERSDIVVEIKRP